MYAMLWYYCFYYLSVNDACISKSPIELQCLPKPACGGRGDCDAAGEIELLLDESE